MEPEHSFRTLFIITIKIPDIQQVMPQHFLTLVNMLLTILTKLLTNTMAHDNDNTHDGSKLTLPRFDPKDPTYFDDLQAYAQDRGLGWLLHAEGEDTNDISKYNDMTSEQFRNLKTSGEDATAEDKAKATKWINDSSVLAGILRRSCKRNPLGRNVVKRALKAQDSRRSHPQDLKQGERSEVPRIVELT